MIFQEKNFSPHQISSIIGDTNGTLLRLDKDDPIGVAAPHDVYQPGINLKHINTNFVYVCSLNIINHIRYASVCHR